jgi:hypothetical protein
MSLKVVGMTMIEALPLSVFPSSPLRHGVSKLICRSWEGDVFIAQCGSGLEYLHRNPASRKRRQNEIPVPGRYNWTTLPLGDRLRESNETANHGHEFNGT